jgi:hypothetical protein
MRGCRCDETALMEARAFQPQLQAYLSTLQADDGRCERVARTWSRSLDKLIHFIVT